MERSSNLDIWIQGSEKSQDGANMARAPVVPMLKHGSSNFNNVIRTSRTQVEAMIRQVYKVNSINCAYTSKYDAIHVRRTDSMT